MSHSCEMLGGLCALGQLESQQLRGQGPPLNRFPHIALQTVSSSTQSTEKRSATVLPSHIFSLGYISSPV